jgi:hypothetical protein
MGTEAPTTVVIPVRCAPKRTPCPTCGKWGRRKGTRTRTVRTVAYKAVAVLEITYAEYAARCGCSTTSAASSCWTSLRGSSRPTLFRGWASRK